MAEALPLRFLAKRFIPQQRFPVLVELVDESNRVKTKVSSWKFSNRAITLDLAALDLIDGGGAEGLGCFPGIAAVADRPDIRGIIGTRGGGDHGIGKQLLLNGEL